MEQPQQENRLLRRREIKAIYNQKRAEEREQRRKEKFDLIKQGIKPPSWAHLPPSKKIANGIYQSEADGRIYIVQRFETVKTGDGNEEERPVIKWITPSSFSKYFRPDNEHHLKNKEFWKEYIVWIENTGYKKKERAEKDPEKKQALIKQWAKEYKAQFINYKDTDMYNNFLLNLNDRAWKAGAPRQILSDADALRIDNLRKKQQEDDIKKSQEAIRRFELTIFANPLLSGMPDLPRHTSLPSLRTQRVPQEAKTPFVPDTSIEEWAKFEEQVEQELSQLPASSGGVSGATLKGEGTNKERAAFAIRTLLNTQTGTISTSRKYAVSITFAKLRFDRMTSLEMLAVAALSTWLSAGLTGGGTYERADDRTVITLPTKGSGKLSLHADYQANETGVVAINNIPMTELTKMTALFTNSKLNRDPGDKADSTEYNYRPLRQDMRTYLINVLTLLENS